MFKDSIPLYLITFFFFFPLVSCVCIALMFYLLQDPSSVSKKIGHRESLIFEYLLIRIEIFFFFFKYFNCAMKLKHAVVAL